MWVLDNWVFFCIKSIQSSFSPNVNNFKRIYLLPLAQNIDLGSPQVTTVHLVTVQIYNSHTHTLKVLMSQSQRYSTMVVIRPYDLLQRRCNVSPAYFPPLLASWVPPGIGSALLGHRIPPAPPHCITNCSFAFQRSPELKLSGQERKKEQAGQKSHHFFLSYLPFVIRC